MAESWRPVPGFEGSYEVSDRGRVRSLGRTVVKSNGVRYPVQPRFLRPADHAGLAMVGLATGRRGRYKHRYIRRLVREVFGDQEAA